MKYFIKVNVDCIQTCLLVVAVACHVYVYSVAATHTRSICRTLQTQHASMQRLNSVCSGMRQPGTRQHMT